jgi:pilus assembly protein CpaB
MNKRLLSVLAFAFVVAAGASFLLYRLITQRMAQNAPLATNQVVVANRNLAVGTMIKDLDVRTTDWIGTPPPQSARKVEDVVGRGVTGNIYQGELILQTRLAAKGAGAGLAATIPPGKRAVAIRINDVAGVAGFVVPGQRVDLLISGTPPNQRNSSLGTMTKTLLQNIEVLSAGQNIQKDSEGKPVSVPVINVLATPEEAEILSLASAETRIQLVLRNPLDTEKVQPPGTFLANLYASDRVARPEAQAVRTARPAPVAAKPPPPPPAAAKPAPPPPIIVEVIHGNRRATARFVDKEKEEEKQGSEVKP